MKAGGSSKQTSSSIQLPQPLPTLIWVSRGDTAVPQQERRAVQSPHMAITGQICCYISKLLSQLEEGTTQPDTSWGSPAKTGVMLHWQDHLLGCPRHLWMPLHKQAAWPENTIPQGESPVAGLSVYFFQLELNKQQQICPRNHAHISTGEKSRQTSGSARIFQCNYLEICCKYIHCIYQWYKSIQISLITLTSPKTKLWT